MLTQQATVLLRDLHRVGARLVPLGGYGFIVEPQKALTPELSARIEALRFDLQAAVPYLTRPGRVFLVGTDSSALSELYHGPILVPLVAEWELHDAAVRGFRGVRDLLDHRSHCSDAVAISLANPEVIANG